MASVYFMWSVKAPHLEHLWWHSSVSLTSTHQIGYNVLCAVVSCQTAHFIFYLLISFLTFGYAVEIVTTLLFYGGVWKNGTTQIFVFILLKATLLTFLLIANSLMTFSMNECVPTIGMIFQFRKTLVEHLCILRRNGENMKMFILILNCPILDAKMVPTRQEN